MDALSTPSKRKANSESKEPQAKQSSMKKAVSGSSSASGMSSSGQSSGPKRDEKLKNEVELQGVRGICQFWLGGELGVKSSAGDVYRCLVGDGCSKLHFKSMGEVSKEELERFRKAGRMVPAIMNALEAWLLSQ